jgi:hypothetical protein
LDLPLQDHMIDVPPVPNIIEMAKIQNAWATQKADNSDRTGLMLGHLPS